MKNDRLFQLLYLLDKERIRAPELVAPLEVSERTVYRDVETLFMAGVPIYATPGKGGGFPCSLDTDLTKRCFPTRSKTSFSLRCRACKLPTSRWTCWSLPFSY